MNKYEFYRLLPYLCPNLFTVLPLQMGTSQITQWEHHR